MSQKGSIFDRLTDPHLYTGAHKHRFDADGRGRGIAGRTDGTGGIKDLSQITRPNLHPDAMAGAHKEKVAHPIRAPSPSVRRRSVSAQPARPASVAETKPASDGRRSAERKGSIFERLTDAKLYTGSHKERFNPDGSGKGKAGRVDTNGPIKDLSQITRPTFAGGTAPKVGAPVRATHSLHPGPDRATPEKQPPRPKSKMSGSIFDRLTDYSSFTGTHKERFHPDGSGKGKAGRVDNSGPRDLSQLTMRR